MALGVAILRLLMLFLNIYETLKVMKRPRPSPRNSGQPTVRALSQRKRNMKGCLAVWIVWCCFMLYERMAEGIVSLFIPFYDEVKSLVLLFLILTRARGAEPIFLHIIRPLVKPYTSTMDAVFDVARMFGDIAFLLATYPFHAVATWWRDVLAQFRTPVEDESPRGLYAEVQQALHAVSHPMAMQPPSRRRSSGLVQDEDYAGVAPAQGLVSRPRVSAEHLDPAARGHVHEIWHPPRAAYHDEDEDDPPPPSPVPDIESEASRREREQMDEWRQYPPFPSAYPPTPLSAPSTLPSISSSAPRRFSPIAEDPPEQERDFGSPPPHELWNPDSVRGVRDEDSLSGVPDSTLATADDMDDEEEDDFDVTLQTPGVVPDTIRAPMTRARAKGSSNNVHDLPVLPSLLSRMSSDTSSVSSASSSNASVVGRKRSRDLTAPALAPAPASALPAPIFAPRGLTHVPLVPIDDDSSSAVSASSASEDEADIETTSSSEPKSPLMKRRRIVSPPVRVQPRRTTRASAEPPPPPPAPRAQRQRDGAAARSSRSTPAPNNAPDGPSVVPQARPARRAAPAKRK